MPKLLARTVFDLYLRVTWNPKTLGQIVVTLLREWSHSNDTDRSWRKNNHFNLLRCGFQSMRLRKDLQGAFEVAQC